MYLQNAGFLLPILVQYKSLYFAFCSPNKLLIDNLTMKSNSPKQSYLGKQLKSFSFAFNGLKLMWQDHNVWVHVPAAIIVTALGAYLEVERSDWLWLVLAISLMWIGETFNTAIEKLTDLASPEYHKLAGEVKDIAAGGVLLCLFCAAIIGILVFYPYLLQLWPF